MESKIFTSTIDSLSFEGHGVCKHNDKVYFVKDCFPGDELELEVIKEKKTYGYARKLKSLKINPNLENQKLCDYQDHCGGCSFLNYKYESQITEKTKLLNSLVKKFRLDYSKEISLIQSPTSSFKNRIQLHNDHKSLGFMKKKSHDIVSIDRCYVANEKVNSLISTLKGNITKLPKKVYLDDRMTTEDVLKQQRLGFRQGNDFINLKMLDYIKSLLSKQTINQVIELFCGQGNFTKILLEYCDQILAYDTYIGDLNSKSVKVNAQTKNLFKDYSIDHKFKNAKLLFLDPPRSGFSDLSLLVKELKSLETIIYISCNPSSCFQDISKFGSKFEISTIQGFDAYPHTPHLEVIVTLSRAITP